MPSGRLEESADGDAYSSCGARAGGV